MPNAVEEVERQVKECGVLGFKWYTAEWRGQSRGWRANDPMVFPLYEKCIQLGVKNMHFHKGPGVEPLSLAKFDVRDIDEPACYTVLAEGSQVATVREITGGRGAEVILDFVGEGNSLVDGVAMLKRASSYYLVGYGGHLVVPTIDIIASEISFVGNLVGTYNDLVELMTLTSQGKVTLYTRRYPLEAANEAIHDLESGQMRGRGILVP